ncbi:glycine betaine/proline transport system ATP-binding protein [Isoptericola jiangsuensis]|uniref:Glycine betaine/proline transport system ATP-binding protein n=1 Tax=Isoptericola jiangsuensis TaxID=548579 RepID=A0A2A9F0P2_9MICO|nr:glycine betaine/L-proline ABC transporter ATP-binding protein [Isoptericola jiangsuensis]PFG44045.1 glycine betaine/proline transport system ATP-binding protein [Isoptericola jiangsuensis]
MAADPSTTVPPTTTRATTSSTPPAVSVRDVYKVFGPRPAQAVERLRAGAHRDELKKLGTAAVIDASFDVAPGEIFVVMGLSGSGKSTLIRMLNGLWTPTAGTVHVGDADLGGVGRARLRAVRRERVSMVFQHFALLPHRTVLDNAAYPLEIQGVRPAERRERAREALDLVGLSGWQDSVPGQLSGGMQQRVGLARALAADTDVLLMDEAFSALDPLIRTEMQDQLLDLQARLGKTVVFITHDLNEAMHLGDRIAIMRDGRIDQIGTPTQILDAPANEYVAQFVADVDRSRVITAAAAMTALDDVPGGAVGMADGPSVTEGTTLADALAPLADADGPLRVVGDDGATLGTLDADDVVSAMANPAASSPAEAPAADLQTTTEGGRA